jgi:ribosomal protein S18 acetylase RimI-like enzyme
MIEIRRFDESDQPAVIRLHHAALGPTGAHLGPGPWDDDLERIGEIYLQRGGEFLVATLDGEVVAMGALLRVDDQVAEIKRMRTAPTHQRQGFGRQLLARLERRGKDLGYHRLCLDTTDKQPAARRLYERAGYRETRRESGRRGDDENIIYEKVIASRFEPPRRSPGTPDRAG